MTDNSPLAKRKQGIPLKTTNYDNQIGTASLKWVLIRIKYEGTCIHCEEIIPENYIAEWHKGIGVRHEKCAKQYEESEKYKRFVYDAALIEDEENFKKFLKLAFETQPFNENQLARYAGYLFDTYEFESAIKFYDLILKKLPKTVYAIVSKGAAYSRLEKYDKTKKCYNLALKYAPFDIDILDRLQRIHFQMGNYKKSILLLKKLAKLSYGENGPKYVGFQKKLIDTYYHIGEFENAIKANQKILNLINDLYGQQMDFNIPGGNDGDMQFWAIENINALNTKRSCLISIIENETREKDALKKINQYLKNEPERFVKSIMFVFYRTFGNSVEANKIWREVLNLKITYDYDIFYALNIYKAQKNNRKIIELCKEHKHNKTLKSHLLYNLAFAYADEKKYIESNKIISELIEDNKAEQIPPDPDLLELMAKNWEKLGDAKMALGTLELSVKLHDSTDSLRKIIKNLRKPGNFDRTLPYLKKLYKLEPNNFTIVIEYISGLIATKSFDDALDLIVKTETEQELSKDDSSVLLLKKATCLFHLGDTVTAHEIFTDLVMQDKKFKDALDGVALTSIKLGKRTLGLKAIKESEKIASSLDTIQKDVEESHPIRIPRKSERALSKPKNVITKPTFRFNPNKKIADVSIVKTAVNSICALFNSKGGVLRIGISDENTLGIQPDLKLFGNKERNNEGFEQYIRKIVGQRLSESQAGKFLSITFPKIKSNVICEINVPFSNVPVYVKTRNKDEEFYVIQNKVSTRLSPRQQVKYIKENFEELLT